MDGTFFFKKARMMDDNSFNSCRISLFTDFSNSTSKNRLKFILKSASEGKFPFFAFYLIFLLFLLSYGVLFMAHEGNCEHF